MYGGDFAAASRDFKKASGIFDFLGDTQLPQKVFDDE